jgi:hypothetical protein
VKAALWPGPDVVAKDLLDALRAYDNILGWYRLTWLYETTSAYAEGLPYAENYGGGSQLYLHCFK